MADLDPESAAASTRDDRRPPTAGHSDPMSAMAEQSAPPPSPTNAAAAPVATALDTRVTAASAAASSSTGSSVASGAGTGDSSGDSATTATADATRLSTAPPPAAGSAPSAADSCSSSSPSSSSSASAALKKCACCQRLLPDGDYSGGQLKAKGKRRCKVCVAGLQKMQSQPPAAHGAAHHCPHSVVHDVVDLLSNPDDELVQAKCLLFVAEMLRRLGEFSSSSADISLNTRTVAGVLRAAKEPQTDENRKFAIECVALLVRTPTLLAQTVAAGAIPVVVQLLRSREPALSAIETVWCVHAVASIAHESRGIHGDALRAAGALEVLLPLVRNDISADLLCALFHSLDHLLDSRPVTEMGAVVAHCGALLMDDTTSPEILGACMKLFGSVLADFAPKGSDSKPPWVGAILDAAPGVPQRLVDLLATKSSDVVVAALELLVNMCDAAPDQMQRLFDCGLEGKLAALLHCAEGEKKARLLAVRLCTSAVVTKAHALSMVDSGPIMERMLALLSTSESKMLKRVVGFFTNVMRHLDRHMTRRMVDECRALPPIVAALRRAIKSGGQPVALGCLSSVADVLAAGEAEATDDPRGVNPYIEPIDRLGVFELADPLQISDEAELADMASRVFSYFTPNDCE